MAVSRKGIFLSRMNDPDVIRRIESLGYDSLWTEEGQGMTAFGKLHEWAAATEVVGLGTCIVNVYSRTPSALAQEAATLDAISDGRVTLGLGVAHPDVVETFHGVQFERPLARIAEYIRLVRRYIRGDRSRFDGEFFEPQRTTFWSEFDPVRSSIPIYNAALGPSNLRLTGQLADGWLPTLFPLDRFDDATDELATGASRVNRERSDIEIAWCAPTAVANDEQTARKAVARQVVKYFRDIPGYYDRIAREAGFGTEVEGAKEADSMARAIECLSDEFIDSIALVGTPAQVCRREHALAEAGIDVVIYDLDPVSDDAELRALTLESLAPK